MSESQSAIEPRACVDRARPGEWARVNPGRASLGRVGLGLGRREAVYTWRVGERRWRLDHTVVMGILNVTLDSFSDGGLWHDPPQAVAHGLEMARQGAEIIDVGGESTRPGSAAVSVQEECQRVVPVIAQLRAALPARVEISVDTRKAAVAAQACQAGASIINDVSGFTFDPDMVEVARRQAVGLVVMHMRGTPETMQRFTHYEDVTGEVTEWLQERVAMMAQAGIEPERVMIDPGFGFSKTAEQNLQLLRELARLQAVGRPVLVGTSRKSTIGAVLQTPVDQRLEGTAATVALAIAGGADVVRVHDVGPLVRVARMADAVVRGWPTIS